MMLGVLIVPWLDGFAKLLGQSLPFLEVAWARFVVQFVIILPIAYYRLGKNIFNFGKWKLQIIRGALLVLMSTLFFASLRTMEIADAIAVFFVHPLLTIVIAPILLGEMLTYRNFFVALIGFCGALIVIRPGMESFDWNSLYALATGFCFSGYILLSKHLAGQAYPIQIVVINGMVGTFLMAFIQPVIWITPNGLEFLWIFAMGSIGLVGHYFITKALEYSSASRMAPLGYFEIIGSVLVGLIAFDNLPNLWTWLGIAVIVCSGLYVMVNNDKNNDNNFLKKTFTLH